MSVGRHKEMEVFLEELVYVSEHTSQDTGVLLISGTGGMGKTKLLRAMKAKAAAMDFRWATLLQVLDTHKIYIRSTVHRCI